MLTNAETDLLCRVGPGTPMGELMRQYWTPVIYDWELEPDGQPQRVRVLGEDLLAWRDTNGVPAFTQDLCPHRGASFYFGRNEECGLRCSYHGWKFDVDGNCVDMPNEPVTSDFKNKLKITSYKGADYGGMIWAYMGPKQDDPPEVPQFEWGLVPENQRHHTHKLIYECNYMQALEGELDSTHVYFLHSRLKAEGSAKYGTFLTERGAKFHVMNTDFGVTYGAQRTEADDGNDYWRTTHFLFPYYGMFPGGRDDGTVPLSIYMPIDDEHTLHMGIRWHPTKVIEGDRKPFSELPEEPGVLGGIGPMLPEQKGKFHANWWPVVNKHTDFHMDLDAKKNKSYTGIPGVRLQDSALIWSMGPIMNRTKEHLGTADAAIIRVRRRLIAAARAFAENGTPPPGSENPEWFKVRSCLTVLPTGTDWLVALDDWHNARTLVHPNPGFMAKRTILEQAMTEELAKDARAQ